MDDCPKSLFESLFALSADSNFETGDFASGEESVVHGSVTIKNDRLNVFEQTFGSENTLTAQNESMFDTKRQELFGNLRERSDCASSSAKTCLEQGCCMSQSSDSGALFERFFSTEDRDDLMQDRQLIISHASSDVSQQQLAISIDESRYDTVEIEK